MSSFTLTRKARVDLKAIAIHSEKKWGKEQRYIYIKQFDDTFNLLARTPDIGHKCDYIKPGYRKFPNSSHVIFFRQVSEDEIQIVRILHKRMDVKSKLADS